MITFIIGLVILFVGAALYGKFCDFSSAPPFTESSASTSSDLMTGRRRPIQKKTA